MKRFAIHGNARFMKTLNRTLVLSVIRELGPISRADIAKVTGLTRPTVTHIVQELLEEGVVVEGEAAPSTGGRKPSLLHLNPSAYTVIGVDIGVRKVTAVAVDLAGHITRRAHRALPPKLNTEAFLRFLDDLIDEIVASDGFSKDKCLGIGVGMHGVVDVERGIALFAPNLGLRDVPLKAHLEARWGLEVRVENDVRAMALGEKWYGQGRDAAHFVCVNVGHGIGAGLVLGGVLYHGASGGAGEFGHITVDPEGPRCNCGNRGCLEVMAAGPALLRRVEEALRAGRPSVLRSLWEAGRLIDGEPITAAAREGDAVAREVLVETGRYLGIGLAGLINLFNPELIIIGGGVAKAWDVLSPPLLATVRERALEPLARRVRIVPSALEEATAVGATTMFLAPMFTLAVG